MAVAGMCIPVGHAVNGVAGASKDVIARATIKTVGKEILKDQVFDYASGNITQYATKKWSLNQTESTLLNLGLSAGLDFGSDMVDQKIHGKPFTDGMSYEDAKRYNAYNRELEAGTHNPHPGMSVEDVGRWKLAEGKVNEHIAVSKVDTDAVLGVRIKELEVQRKLANGASAKAVVGEGSTVTNVKSSSLADDVLDTEIIMKPTAHKQTEFASTYEARLNQTPSIENKKVQFVGTRGESLAILKPPPDPALEKWLKDAGVDGILYSNAIPDFSPVSRAEVEIEYMLGSVGPNGNKARNLNFQQANAQLASMLNESPEMAKEFGFEAGNIKISDIEKYRIKNDLTWHELNDGKTLQLVPSDINITFGHLGGVGEINAGLFKK